MTTATAPAISLAAIVSRPMQLARDYAQLIKIRVTTLVVVTAWCGYYFGRHKSGLPVMGWPLLWALAGIGMVSAGTACMNEIMERKSDALMRRTAQRPMVTGSLRLGHALTIWAVFTFGGAALLATRMNLLTAGLTLATAATYLLIYTPLKKISPLCTFVGAFPGRCPACWVGLRRADISRSKRWCCSRSSSSGSSRTFIPLRCFIAMTTLARAFACCPWWKAMAAPPTARF